MEKLIVEQEGAVTKIAGKKGFRFFVTSDVHFDSIHCNRSQFFKDLNFAVEHDARIFIIGDFFDAMQGRFDPRRDMSKVRPEYRYEDYYDRIVKDAIEKLKPYSANLMLFTDGNHEASVLKNANTDLTGRLVDGLSRAKTPVYRGGYGGILLLNDGGYITPAKYFHGSGGEAPVTRGAIQTNRQAVFLPDFKIILNGHSHHSYWIPIVRERVSDSGAHYFDIQHHVRTPGYQMSYGDGSTGWEVTRGGVPKPIGSTMLDINQNDILVTPLIRAPKPIEVANNIYDGEEYPQD